MSSILYEAYQPKDREEVFRVLQASMPVELTMEWFHWKHELNPFGASLAWIARDEEGIVGCNFFMQYRLGLNGEERKALRSCESAVLPRGRRKGIFSNCVQHAHKLIESGTDYATIIGTPNASSLPGFLKMQWTQVPAFYYGIYPVVLGSYARLSADPKEVYAALMQESISNKQYVLKDEAYYQWRYSAITGRDYRMAALASSTNGCACIYKIREIKGLRAVVVLEISGTPSEQSQLLRSICRKEHAWLVVNLCQAAYRGTPSYVLKKGYYDFIYYKPGVVINNWDMRLGDLEDIL